MSGVIQPMVMDPRDMHKGAPVYTCPKCKSPWWTSQGARDCCDPKLAAERDAERAADRKAELEALKVHKYSPGRRAQRLKTLEDRYGAMLDAEQGATREKPKPKRRKKVYTYRPELAGLEPGTKEYLTAYRQLPDVKERAAERYREMYKKDPEFRARKLKYNEQYVRRSRENNTPTHQERKERKRERNKAYYAKNKNKMRARSREYYQQNKERCNAKAKERYHAKKEAGR